MENDDFTRFTTQRHMTLYDKEKSDGVCGCGNVIKYHDRRVDVIVNCLSYSMINTVMIYLLSFTIYLADPSQLSYLKSKFDYRLVVGYFLFYYIVEIQYLPVRFTLLNECIIGCCSCYPQHWT